LSLSVPWTTSATVATRNFSLTFGQRATTGEPTILRQPFIMPGLLAIGANSSALSKAFTAVKVGYIDGAGAEVLPLPIIVLDLNWRMTLVINNGDIADRMGPVELVVLRIPVEGRHGAP